LTTIIHFRENLYFAINTFLNFNVFASIGSLSANYIQQVVFKNEWWFTIAGSIMAYTCGYFSSLALIYTPR
ncbi:hypothetical protein COOONC_26888, partial [Cooperia oncophora]